MTTTTPHDIHGLIDELTTSHTHRERYAIREGLTTWTRDHITHVPSLLDQLQQAAPASTGETGAGGFASRPAAHLESLDTLIHIDLEAARWIRDLGEDDHHTQTADTLRQLHGLHASATHCDRPRAQRDKTTRKVTCCTAHAIEADVHRWWTQARIVTGWDSPAWRPANTCPNCGKRGALRVRLAQQAALCVDCRETWGPDLIGLLAEHIRHENLEPDTDDDAHDQAS